MARLGRAVAALALLCGCAASESDPPASAHGPAVDPALLFRDLTPGGGLPATSGPGVALVDVDDDGDDDLLLSGDDAIRVLLNQGDATFVPGPDLPDSEGAQALAAADLTGDGAVDLLAVDPRELRLFERQGGGWARSARLPELPVDGEYAAVTLGDYRLRGRLDLVAARLHASEGGSSPVAPLFLAQGDDGAYVKTSVPAFDAPLHARVAATLDLNGDGRLDVWVGQEGFAPSRAYLGDGTGGFTESSAALGLDLPASAMGFDAGDIDGDGDLDLVVANLFPGGQLFVREGERYVEAAKAHGLDDLDTWSTWGLALFDADNDGDLDLLAASGFGQGEVEGAVGLERVYYENDGAGHFSRRLGATGSGLDVLSSARGAAFGDLDGDGDLDAVITSVDAPPQLLRNELGAGHWLQLQLRYPWHRPAVGAVVTVQAGGRALRRWVIGTPSYASSSSERVHVGLGDAPRYDALEIRWPNGVVQSEPGGAANRTLTVAYRPAGR